MGDLCSACRVDPFRPDFDPVPGAPGLYIGSRPERGYEQQREWLAAGIQTIVCLEPRVHYTVPTGVLLVHTPMRDIDGPEGLPTDIMRLLSAVRAAGGPTLIHCTAGLNRSAFVAVALLCTGGVEVTSAIARVRQARRGALFNRTYETHLLEVFRG